MSDILITLITMLLWIGFQKPSAPFIRATLCLRSLHRAVIQRYSLPILFIMHQLWRMQVCVRLHLRAGLCPRVYTAQIYYSRDQPQLTELCITYYHGKIC